MFALDPIMELCRLCACYDAIKMEIFGEEGKERNLVNKIQTCLPFQVSETDKLPKSMCYRCMYNLENFYDFRNKTMNAMMLLEMYIGKPEGSFEVSADLKEQFENLKMQLQHIRKKKVAQEKENTMPHLEPQLPEPAAEVANGRLNSPASRPTTPLEDDVDEEIMDLEMDESQDVIIDNSSMECEVLEDMVIESALRAKKDGKNSAEQKTNRLEDDQSEETLHTCSICNKAFSSKGHLALHNKIHTKESATTKSAQEANNSSASGTAWKSGYYRPYHCDLCNKSYSTAKHRWGHVSVCHRGDPLVTCPVCSRVFSTCYNLGEHKRTKHGIEDDNDGNLVDVPEEAVPSIKTKSVSSPRHSPSPKASPSFPSNNLLKSLSTTAKNQQPQPALFSLDEGNTAVLHTCAQCLKVFKTEGELERHSLSHSRSSAEHSTPEPSRKSISGFSSEMSLLKQTLLQNRSNTADGKKRHSSGDEAECSANKKIAAANAPETTPSGGSRRKNSKPRKIEQRNEEITKENLELSSEDSLANQGYICGVCSQMFSSVTELQEHNVVHEEEAVVTATESSTAKPFSCLLCEKDFSLRTSLSRHFNACHGIDPAEIMDISKYQRPPKKVVPITKENDKVPTMDEEDLFGIDEEDDEESDPRGTEGKSQQGGGFACEVCSREFGDRASLWLHLRYTHKEYAAYACGVCLQICENNTQMYEHWTTQHPPDRASTEQRRYSCQMCGRQHDSRKKLLAHVLVHNLDDGSGGTYDPELLVTLNTGFYNFDGQENHESPATVNEFNSSLDPENVGVECSGGEYSNTAGSSALFGCELCYKSFPTEDGLVKHKKGAHRLDPRTSSSTSNNSKGSYQLYFVCELCGSSHRSKSERWRHVFRTHGGEQALTCDRPGCGKVFPTRALRHDHCTNHHRLQGATPNVCEICGKLWGTRVDFWKHLMGVHPDCVPLTCGVCLKIFCSVPELQSHVSANHVPLTGGDFCCDICGRPYSNRSKLSRHRRIHLVGESGDISSYSEISFSAPGSATKKSAPPPLTPKSLQDTAGKFDRSQAEFLGFKNKPKPPVLPPLYCDACPDAVFENITKLAEHRRIIHGLFPCDLCSKFYGRTSHLWKHVKRVHNNHPELTCPICKRISASKIHLETHIATKHRSMEPKTSTPKAQGLEAPSPGTPTLYPCQQCSTQFYKYHLLRKHQQHCPAGSQPEKIKSEEDIAKEYPCENCSKVFSSSSKLRDHRRVIHAPQTCELCPDVTYISKVDLLQHIKSSHADAFACSHPGCNRTMRSRADRDRHIAMHRSFKYPPTCSLCGENCMNRVKAWSHFSTRHKSAISNVCGVCYDHFPSTGTLVEHVRALHARVLRNKDTCKICVKTYSSFYKVLLHHSNHHPDYHICRECLEVFAEKQDLESHTEKEHGNEEQEEKEEEEKEDDKLQDDTKKNINTSEVKTEEALEEALEPGESVDKKETAEKGGIQCDQCGEEFATENERNEHIALNHNTEGAMAKRQRVSDTGGNPSCVKRPRRSYDCEKCSEVFRTPSELVEHKKQHQGTPIPEVKPYHCSQCEKYFTNKSSYWRHINSPAHHAAKLQVQQKSINEHSTQSSDSATNKSTVCIPESSLRETLMRRAKIELDMLDDSDHDNKSFTGSDIDKEASLENESLKESTVTVQKSNRKRPESRKVYSGGPDVPCQCQLCGKRWPAMKHLWQHLIRNHRQEAAVTCGVCLEVCQDYSSLSAHLASQHPDNFIGEGNNFTCRICGRYHNARSKLIQHATIHIILGSAPEEQPQSNVHSCRFCFKAFTNESTLDEHLKMHHSSPSVTQASCPPERSPHTCDICFKVCGNEGALVTHKKSHQRGTNEYRPQSEEADVIQTDEESNESDMDQYGEEEEEDDDDDGDDDGGGQEDDDEDDDNDEQDDDNEEDEEEGVSERKQFYSCSMCSKTFRDKEEFADHKKKHPHISDLQLQMRRTQPRVSIAELPKQEIEKQTFYVCSVCSQVFKTQAALAMHQDRNHRPHEPPASQMSRPLSIGKFPCASCSESFSTIAALSEHVKASHAKMFTCTRCNKKSFSSYGNLTKHYRMCQSSHRLQQSQSKNQLESSTNLSEDSHDSSGDNEETGDETENSRSILHSYSNARNVKSLTEQGAKRTEAQSTLDSVIGIPNIGLSRLSSSSDDSDEDTTRLQECTNGNINKSTELSPLKSYVSDHEIRTSNSNSEANEGNGNIKQNEVGLTYATSSEIAGSKPEIDSIVILSDDESQTSVKSVEKENKEIFVVSLSDDSEMSFKDCKESTVTVVSENCATSEVIQTEIKQELAYLEDQTSVKPEPIDRANERTGSDSDTLQLITNSTEESNLITNAASEDIKPEMKDTVNMEEVKGKDCFFSLEDALVDLEAENSK